VNCKRKSRRRFFLLMRWRTPPISSEFRGGGFETPQTTPSVRYCLSLVSVVFCKGEISAMCRSLVQRSPIDCGVSECDRETSIMRRPWSTRGLLCHGREKITGTATVYLYLKSIYSQIRNSKCKVSPLRQEGM